MPNHPEIIYEDNHYIAVNKLPSEIVQGDKTGDRTLAEDVKDFIKDRDKKPGNVFLGIIHRLDRPTSGIVLFAKTSKGLSRMNEVFRSRKVEKGYWAVVEGIPGQDEYRIENFLKKNEKQNKSYTSTEKAGGKKAISQIRVLERGDRYSLVEIEIETGRHHQIRCHLSELGHPVQGDLKYGARRSLSGGAINLHARRLAFVHPVKQSDVEIVANPPLTGTWRIFKLSGGY